MRIFLDHNISHNLQETIENSTPQDCEITTAYEKSWRRFDDKELIESVEECYDIFITGDTSIDEEQNLNGCNLGIIIIRGKTNRDEHTKPLIENNKCIWEKVETQKLLKVNNSGVDCTEL